MLGYVVMFKRRTNHMHSYKKCLCGKYCGLRITTLAGFVNVLPIRHCKLINFVSHNSSMWDKDWLDKLASSISNVLTMRVHVCILGYICSRDVCTHCSFRVLSQIE